MFKGNAQRYKSKMIDETIHIEIQKLLWNLIDIQSKEELELDYLQKFELRVNNGEQLITQKQEIPRRKLEWRFKLKHTVPIVQTIWCIDNGEYQMMLLPGDY